MSKAAPWHDTELFARQFVAAARHYGGRHHLTERIAVQLLALWKLARRQNRTPYFTHCKLASMRGVEHRNTSREIIGALIVAGIIEVRPNDDAADAAAYRQAILAGGVKAPGYNPGLHVTSFTLGFAAVARFDYRPTAAAAVADAATVAAALQSDIQAIEKDRIDRRDAAAIRRQLAAAGHLAASQARVEARRRGERDDTADGRRTIEAAAAVAFKQAADQAAKALGVDPARYLS